MAVGGVLVYGTGSMVTDGTFAGDSVFTMETASNPMSGEAPAAVTAMAPVQPNPSSAEPTTSQQPTVATSITVQPNTVYPGDVILIRSQAATSVQVFNQTYKLKEVNGEYARFIPVPISAKPYTYTVQSTDQKMSQTFTIAAKTFDTDAITVSKQMNSMRQNTERIDADQLKINKARSQSAPTPYFTGPFVMPAKGELTTPYGYQRVVNGQPANRHLAIDIANKEGTPIIASHNGKVVLADSMYLTGNTIIIDHGMNLFSIYAHLSKLDVKVDQPVKQGQIIGRLGTTGFSTGPHLHYGMLVGNTYINPNPFFQDSPYEWK